MQDIGFQVALFPLEKESFLKNPSLLIAEISQAVKQSSSNELEKQNIFPEMSTPNSGMNFPRVIAATLDDSIVFQVSDSRINFIVQTTQSPLMTQTKFWKIVESILSTDTLKKMQFRRLGFIRTYLKETDSFIPYAQAILADEWETNIDNFTLQLGYRTSQQNLDLNVNMAISGVINLDTKQKAIHVQADINSLEEEDISSSALTPFELLKSFSEKNLLSKYIDPLIAVDN